MSRVPYPERGQPLDVSYLYSLAQSINTLAGQVNDNTQNYSTVNTFEMGPVDVKSSELRFVAENQVIVSDTTVIANTPQEMHFEFSPAFKYIPIVVLTPVNNKKNPVGNNVVATIKEVTTGKVDYTVRFNVGGQASVSMNILAIGIAV
jgi:hypothetical protein